MQGDPLFLQNVMEEVHLTEEGNSLVPILVLQAITEEVGLLRRLMKRKQETEGARGQDLQMISLTSLTKMKKL